MKKLVFISYLHLTKKVYNDFYFDALQKSGYELEYWDLSNIYFNTFSITDSILSEIVLNFNSLNEVENKVQNENLDETLFFPQITFEWRVIGLFRIFSKYSCKTVFFARGALPGPGLKVVSGYIKNNSIPELIKKVFNYLRAKVPLILKHIGYIKYHNYIFNSGFNGMQTIGVGYEIDKKYSSVIQVNSFDYDNYLNSVNEYENLVNEKYCVFLDEFLPFHPDWDILNYGKVDPEEYFKTMNRFFDFIENTYKLKVVIAAHPKSEYLKNPFNDRLIIKYKTNDLVKFSEFTMAHMSSSINFAVLYKRKILLLITDAYKLVYKNSCYLTSQYFGLYLDEPLINCNNKVYNDFNILSINEEKYDKYKYDFLTSKQSESMNSQKILLNWLKDL